jgi:hypothetical protein
MDAERLEREHLDADRRDNNPLQALDPGYISNGCRS